MVCGDGMFLFILGQHVLENVPMSLRLTILEMGFRTDCCHMYVVCLCKTGYFFRVKFRTCIHSHFMWSAGPHQPGLHEAFKESICSV